MYNRLNGAFYVDYYLNNVFYVFNADRHPTNIQYNLYRTDFSTGIQTNGTIYFNPSNVMATADKFIEKVQLKSV